MKYDFTTVLDRKGKDSIAVEPFEADWIKWPGTVKEGFDIIPMWVADMNILFRKPLLREQSIPLMAIFPQERNILTPLSSGIKTEMVWKG